MLVDGVVVGGGLPVCLYNIWMCVGVWLMVFGVLAVVAADSVFDLRVFCWDWWFWDLVAWLFVLFVCCGLS